MSRLIDADALIELLRNNTSNDIQDQIITENNINLIMNIPTAYSVEKVVDYTHDIICNILEKVLEPLPDGSEYPEEAYRLLYLNTRISDAIRNGGKE